MTLRILHQVWIQGPAQLPEKYVELRRQWSEILTAEDPNHWELLLWDNKLARRQWPDYASVEAQCYHHATRCDLILARAIRDFGGLAMGVDVAPQNVRNLLEWLRCNDTLLVVNPSARSASNGVQYSARPGHPFWGAVCRHQLRNPALLSHPNVWRSTGPGCYWEVLASRPWKLSLATDARAYTHAPGGDPGDNPDAWVNPGYAGSWH